MNELNYHLEARIRYLTTEEGGRSSAVHTGYRGQFHYVNDSQVWDATQQFIGCNSVEPGDDVLARLKFISPLEHRTRISVGMKFTIQEGARIVGVGVIENINPRFI